MSLQNELRRIVVVKTDIVSKNVRTELPKVTQRKH